MSRPVPSGGDAGPDAEALVANAIQDLVAARLGRGFVPLALLFGVGAVDVLRAAPGGWLLAGGALFASGAMLACGLRIVQRSLSRPDRPWMEFAMLTSVVPPVYALYVLGWRGLRALAEGLSSVGVLVAVLHVLVGVWLLRSWMRVVEIERLVEVMSVHSEGEGTSS
ncbi:MAG: hypothetical protein OEN56_13345 [Gemmatimonadota bacterium]|nr:hypothetical protein [Gemmatimonadota bacterium]MDH3424433.1 hypothetical protein [Gemmatimonadota bacterium]